MERREGSGEAFVASSSSGYRDGIANKAALQRMPNGSWRSNSQLSVVSLAIWRFHCIDEQFQVQLAHFLVRWISNFHRHVEDPTILSAESTNGLGFKTHSDDS